MNINNTELDRIESFLKSTGYDTNKSSDCVIVKDPVFSCGCGINKGKLILTGYNDVIIRTFEQAVKFVLIRD